MDNFLNKNLITELGIDKLPEDKQEEALLRMGDVIFHGVLIRILEILNEEERKELENFLADIKNQNDPDAFYSFIKNKIPDVDKVVEEEIASFKKEAMGTMEGIG